MPDRLLFFDVETTGKADFKRPASDPCQPRLVQLAVLLVEGDKEIASLNSIVEPHGFTISDDVAKIHGITHARACELGATLSTVLSLFQDFASCADWFVGHNVDFDKLVIQSEFHRAGLTDPFENKLMFCTMKNSTDVCCLPGPYGFKWPRLGEVYQIAFNEPLVNAHNAMVDLKATWRVYEWLKNKLVERSISGQPVFL